MTMNILLWTLRESSRRTLLPVTTFTSQITLNCGKCNTYATTTYPQVAGVISKRFICTNLFSFGEFARKSENTLLHNKSAFSGDFIRRSVVTTSQRENNSRNDDEALSNLSSTRKKRLLEEPDETEPHVIYTGLLSGQIKRLKLFSISTSGMGLMLQPVLIQQSAQTSLVANIAIFSMVGFFTFVTPYLIHLIAKKYVTEIVYNPAKDLYTATTYTFFLRNKQTAFTVDQLEVPDLPGPFTAMNVKSGDNQKVPLFIAPESFLKPSHYGRFMGYDKPINLHLNVASTESNAESKSSKPSE